MRQLQLHEAMEEIREFSLISGYEPDRDNFGEYDPETGVFYPVIEGHYRQNQSAGGKS